MNGGQPEDCAATAPGTVRNFCWKDPYPRCDLVERSALGAGDRFRDGFNQRVTRLVGVLPLGRRRNNPVAYCLRALSSDEYRGRSVEMKHSYALRNRIARVVPFRFDQDVSQFFDQTCFRFRRQGTFRPQCVDHWHGVTPSSGVSVRRSSAFTGRPGSGSIAIIRGISDTYANDHDPDLGL